MANKVVNLRSKTVTTKVSLTASLLCKIAKLVIYKKFYIVLFQLFITLYKNRFSDCYFLNFLFASVSIFVAYQTKYNTQ